MRRTDPRYCDRCGFLFPSPKAKTEHDQERHGAAAPAANTPTGAIGKMLAPVDGLARKEEAS